MASANVNKVLEEAKALSPGERRQLVALLNDLPAEGPPVPAEDALDKALLKAGVLRAIPPRDIEPAEFRSWKPVEVQGKPISETIIEERR